MRGKAVTRDATAPRLPTTSTAWAQKLKATHATRALRWDAVGASNDGGLKFARRLEGVVSKRFGIESRPIVAAGVHAVITGKGSQVACDFRRDKAVITASLGYLDTSSSQYKPEKPVQYAHGTKTARPKKEPACDRGWTNLRSPDRTLPPPLAETREKLWPRPEGQNFYAGVYPPGAS